jgi:MoxR-like ATPase
VTAGPADPDRARSVDDLTALLAAQRYLADPSLATVLYLGLVLGKPVLLEGEAGVGKTEVAKALAAALGRRLIRLQCYEGLDVASAVYEWDFARQMLEIRIAEAAGTVGALALYSERFLLRRPLLDALSPDPAGPPVLLIDELDRTDEPFEAFLLEVLSDFQVSIPELGTVRAAAPPIVIVTSNRTREIHDALKRRCLYHWIDHPDAARELAILAARAPEVPPRLAEQIVAFVQRLRATDLFKLPGVAETLDWGHALVALGCVELDPATVDATLGVLLKYQDDLARVAGKTARELVDAARSGPAGPSGP